MKLSPQGPDPLLFYSSYEIWYLLSPRGFNGSVNIPETKCLSLWLVWGEPTVSNPGPTPHILSKSTICFCSNVLFSFLHLSVCSFIFLASVCPSIYCAAIERMFTSRCLCAIIRQCRITLSLC